MCNRYGKADQSEDAIQNELELSRDASRRFDWRKPKNRRKAAAFSRTAATRQQGLAGIANPRANDSSQAPLRSCSRLGRLVTPVGDS
jgi:hypothetical protein